MDKILTHDEWCNEVEEHANNTMGGALINWRQIDFNWAERYMDGSPVATCADQLIVEAQKQINARIAGVKAEPHHFNQ